MYKCEESEMKISNAVPYMKRIVFKVVQTNVYSRVVPKVKVSETSEATGLKLLLFGGGTLKFRN